MHLNEDEQSNDVQEVIISQAHRVVAVHGEEAASDVGSRFVVQVVSPSDERVGSIIVDLTRVII